MNIVKHKTFLKVSGKADIPRVSQHIPRAGPAVHPQGGPPQGGLQGGHPRASLLGRAPPAQASPAQLAGLDFFCTAPGNPKASLLGKPNKSYSTHPPTFMLWRKNVKK